MKFTSTGRRQWNMRFDVSRAKNLSRFSMFDIDSRSSVREAIQHLEPSLDESNVQQARLNTASFYQGSTAINMLIIGVRETTRIRPLPLAGNSRRSVMMRSKSWRWLVNGWTENKRRSARARESQPISDAKYLKPNDHRAAHSGRGFMLRLENIALPNHS